MGGNQGRASLDAQCIPHSHSAYKDTLPAHTSHAGDTSAYDRLDAIQEQRARIAEMNPQARYLLSLDDQLRHMRVVSEENNGCAIVDVYQETTLDAGAAGRVLDIVADEPFMLERMNRELDSPRVYQVLMALDGLAVPVLRFQETQLPPRYASLRPYIFATDNLSRLASAGRPEQEWGTDL